MVLSERESRHEFQLAGFLFRRRVWGKAHQGRMQNARVERKACLILRGPAICGFRGLE